MTRWTLSDVMALSLAPPPSHTADPDAVKFNQRLVDKLKYCKEVLVSIRTASAAGGSGVPEETEAMAMGLGANGGGAVASGTLAGRASKMNLR